MCCRDTLKYIRKWKWKLKWKRKWKWIVTIRDRVEAIFDLTALQECEQSVAIAMGDNLRGK